MSDIVHLKWGEQPQGDCYLMITRHGRIRGEDFYVQSSAEEEIRAARAFADESYASLASALRKARSMAERDGVGTIYIRMP
jgi:hypothetical protein